MDSAEDQLAEVSHARGTPVVDAGRHTLQIPLKSPEQELVCEQIRTILQRHVGLIGFIPLPDLADEFVSLILHLAVSFLQSAQ
mmetsp:Transcript_92567/g.215089  ORF Transcript_92567/g.215089 Transcript_92567/m.215089 type:complete len:83 (-) Transcript_92567:314-562(-)